MDNNPILKLLFRNVESTQMIRAKSSSKDKLQLQTNEHNNRNTIPIVKSAGNKCTTFNDSGYFLSFICCNAVCALLFHFNSTTSAG